MSVMFGNVLLGEHIDNRRKISDIVFPENLPFLVRQMKDVVLSDVAIQVMTVGNHYHTQESGRHEFFVILGQEGVPLFSMRYRDGI